MKKKAKTDKIIWAKWGIKNKYDINNDFPTVIKTFDESSVSSLCKMYLQRRNRLDWILRSLKSSKLVLFLRSRFIMSRLGSVPIILPTSISVTT